MNAAQARCGWVLIMLGMIAACSPLSPSRCDPQDRNFLTIARCSMGTGYEDRLEKLDGAVSRESRRYGQAKLENEALVREVDSALASAARAQEELLALEDELSFLNAAQTDLDTVLQRFANIDRELRAAQNRPLSPQCKSLAASLSREIDRLKEIAQADLTQYEAVVAIGSWVTKGHVLLRVASFFLDLKTVAKAFYDFTGSETEGTLACRPMPAAAGSTEQDRLRSSSIGIQHEPMLTVST